jgi:acetylornithine/N-succinyldiaminopimelate aminotransferase
MQKKDQSLITKSPFPKQYSSQPLLLDHGKGVYVFDGNGNTYLDFGSGIAVNALGYGREDIAEIACSQMKKAVHVSNLYITQPAMDLAQKLINTGDFTAVHFGNSGSEANESALKYARLYSYRTKGEGKNKILCFNNGFHGRTLGALSCTPTGKYQEPFQPLIGEVYTADLNNVEQLEEILDDTFAAVILEVIQGEGGLQTLSEAFVGSLQRLCETYDIILIADEIQTGLGRTGSLYAFQQRGLKPDIVSLAKPLAGGLPLSATLIPEKIDSLLHIGEHGTTFGGGPVTTAVGSYIFDIISAPEFLETVKKKGSHLRNALEKMQKQVPGIDGLRGFGLLQGIALSQEKKTPEGTPPAERIMDIIERCRDRGLLILRSGSNVLRLAPPLVISEDELSEGVSIITSVLDDLFKKN